MSLVGFTAAGLTKLFCHPLYHFLHKRQLSVGGLMQQHHLHVRVGDEWGTKVNLISDRIYETFQRIFDFCIHDSLRPDVTCAYSGSVDLVKKRREKIACFSNEDHEGDPEA